MTLEFSAEQPWSTVHIQSVGNFKNEIAHTASTIAADATCDPAGFARQARLAAGLLPLFVRETMEDFIVSGDGALLWTDLIVGPIPETPSDSVNDATRYTLMAKQTAALLSSVCHLVGYRAESKGEIVQSVVPTEADQQEQTSTGSRKDLLPHTEQAFNRLRPDFLALGSLRGDPNAVTYAMSARTLVRQLPGYLVDLLRQPRFYCGVDTSFVRGGASAEIRGPTAVLSGPTSDPVFTFDGELMFSDSSDHRNALEAVTAVWAENRSGVVLKPGDVLIIDNTRTIHGRSAFRPQFDGGDRWLCRLQGRCNPAATRHARPPGSPIIEIAGC
ncbi:TauD/TfdA family dioxygenase [Mycobacterium asiaticum]|uniref:TauD/TfdA family dioxygenase n=1 Tax=Mycobacterium asiaticum TaxID=1790 RepID=UPI0009B91296|nr:TauD/TfdA family dioxygenase [Mycobacterium asiaticum]ORA16391.1 clavaminate synthase [Mycobacterium asiaticum DSM 44297]